jgi:hypothetical protein
MGIKDRKLMVIENRLSRRICRSKREGIIAGCTKVHNKEVHTSFSSAANGDELGETDQTH